MAHILTITMNPAIDISTSVERIQPTRKLRCAPARRDPGGGGINVARVVDRLGSDATALYPAGGACGQTLLKLVEQENIRSIAIPIGEETREDFTVVETTTGHEYRFVSNGPQLERDGVAQLPGGRRRLSRPRRLCRGERQSSARRSR